MNDSALLRNANVVDVRTGDVRRGVDIEIADGRIAAIGEGGSAAASSAGVDLAGAYVVPGYNDMHAHTLQLDDPSGAYRLMLAHGVTGYRQMAGSPQLLARRAAGGFPDTVDAPALLLLPGDLLTPLNAASPEAVREEVRRQHAQGADFVKMAFIAGSVYPRRRRRRTASASLSAATCRGRSRPRRPRVSASASSSTSAPASGCSPRATTTTPPCTSSSPPRSRCGCRASRARGSSSRS